VRVVRREVFETNSSSSHSVSIKKEEIIKLTKINRQLEGYFADYGRQHEILRTPEEKLSYVLTMIVSKYVDTYSRLTHNDLPAKRVLRNLKANTYYVLLNELVKKYTGYEIGSLDEEDIYDSEDIIDFGSIDHQSADTLDEYFKDIDTFKTIALVIFNDNAKIIVDSDEREGCGEDYDE
jgi:hypothetical protein